MKERAKKIVKAVVFCLLALLMTCHITRLLTPKWLNTWDASKVARTFYNLDKDTVDVLFAGSSCGAAAIDPFKLYDDYGIMSYDLVADQQTLTGTYYWLKEALKTQHPQIVMVEMVSIGIKDSTKKVSRRSYDHMDWSLNKVRYAFDAADTEEPENTAEGEGAEGAENAAASSSGEYMPLISYLFPLYMYHDRWDALTPQDYGFIYGDDLIHTRGYRPHTRVFGIAMLDSKYRDYSGMILNPDVMGETSPENTEALLSIIKLCEEEDIQLILYKTFESAWGSRNHNLVAKIAEELGVPFVDMNMPEEAAELGIVFAEDANDRRHLNTRGAAKTTAFIGKYLKENYDLPDRRDDPEAAAIIEADRPYYDHIMEDCESCYLTDLPDIIRTWSRERYLIIIAGAGKPGTFTREQREAFYELGVTGEFLDDIENGFNVAAAFGNTDRPAFLSDNSTAVTVRGVMPSGYEYRAVGSGPDVSIGIAGNEWAFLPDVVNIAVYDTETGELADRFFLLKGKDGSVTFSREAD